jgi:hypothetical protein
MSGIVEHASNPWMKSFLIVGCGIESLWAVDARGWTHVPYSVFYVLYSMFCILVLYVLYSMFCILVFYVLYSMFCILVFLYSCVLCFVLYALYFALGIFEL